MTTDHFADGGCCCGEIRYVLLEKPMFVHCCHCSWCQRETGSAFAVNALIETTSVSLQRGQPRTVATPSASGNGQLIVRCPTCHVAVWSHYSGAGNKLAFVRTGTLDDATLCAPDVHIFTSTRRPWVSLPDDALVFAEFYRYRDTWPAASYERLRRLRD